MSKRPPGRAVHPFGLMLVCLGTAGLTVAGCASSTGMHDPDASGRLLITLDDADAHRAMRAGRLDEEDLAAVDTLTVLRLPLPRPGDSDGSAVGYSQVSAPNSARSGQPGLALSADGALALVVSPDLAADAGSAATQAGVDSRVTLIDLRSGDARAVGTISVGPGPVSAAFHPLGGKALVLCRGSRELRLVATTPDAIIAHDTFLLSWFLDGDDEVGSVSWHPGGFFVAVTIPNKNRVAFFEIEEREGAMSLRPWGAPALAGARPDFGMWSPDGRFFLSVDRVFDDAEGGMNILTASGSVSVIRIADTVELSGDVQHERVEEVSLPIRANAMAISPDGCFVVTTAGGSRAKAPGGPGDSGGRIFLIEFNTVTGEARVVDEQRASAAPSGVAFAPDGRTVCVADIAQGEVQVWRLDRAPSPALTYTGVNVSTGPAPHAVAIVR